MEANTTLSESLKYKIAIELLPLVGSVTAKLLIAHCGSPEAVFTMKKSDLLRIPGVGEGIAREVVKQAAEALQRAEKELEFIAKNNIKVLYYTDDEYPERLKVCDDSPVVLYVKGNADLNARRMLSIVGTRKATRYGQELCDFIVNGLVKRGHNPVIVSGLAYGIDGYAHRAALRNNLPTFGVVAHGLDTIYPSQHRGLATDMLEQGALLTDIISETPLERKAFLRRNRIVAGLCDGLLVVESGEKGGALVTADIADSYNRQVFACPGRVGDASSKGCNDLIKTCKAQLVESAEDIEAYLNWDVIPKDSKPIQSQLFTNFTADEAKVMELLSAGKQNIDVLARQTGIAAPALSGLLLKLEFAGHVKSLPGKTYALSRM